MIKILIVDDEEIIRKAMGKTFGKYGACTSVEKGLEALKTYQEAFDKDEPFDLIILSYFLEDLSGLDILKEIRENEKEKNIPKIDRSKIIMVTGHNEVDIVKECIAAGCNNYMLKPVKPATVEENLLKLGIKLVDKTEEPETDSSEDSAESAAETDEPEESIDSSEAETPDEKEPEDGDSEENTEGA